MSHFTVLVIGPDPEKQLAPFQENNMGDCPKKYLKFVDEEAEMRKEYKTKKRRMLVLKDGTMEDPYKREYKIIDPKDPMKGIGISSDDKYIYPEGSKIKKVPFTKLYKTFEDFACDWHGHEKRDAEKKRYGHWHNPRTKWDWITLGGRWTGFFTLKDKKAGKIGEPGLMTPPATDPKSADSALKGDIDFAAMRDARSAEARKDWTEVNAVIAGREFLSFAEVLKVPRFKKNANLARKFYWDQPVIADLKGLDRRVDSPEEYRVPVDKFCADAANDAGVTFAVLKDGKWYERGSMGWWGMVSNEKDQDKWNSEFRKLVDGLPDDTLLSVFDCHI